MSSQPLTPDEAGQRIRDAVEVTPQMIIIAKRFLIDQCSERAANPFETRDLYQMFLTDRNVSIPDTIVLVRSVDPGPELQGAADGISWTLAFVEAIWGLIYAGFLIEENTARFQPRLDVHCKRLQFSSALPHDVRSIQCPTSLRVAPSRTDSKSRYLTDGDMFITTIGADTMSNELAQTLRESSRCLRFELYLASLALLGLASETAWIEMGLSLVRVLQKSKPNEAGKFHSDFTDPRNGPKRKVDRAKELYGKPEIECVQARCGVPPADLNVIAQWSDCVRDSRNSVHYGITSSFPNNYEKVATLLMQSVPSIRVLCRIKTAADDLAV